MNSLSHALRIAVVVIVAAATHRPRAEAAPSPLPSALAGAWSAPTSLSTPSVAALLADARDGHWDEHSLWQAAGLAAGEETGGAVPSMPAEVRRGPGNSDLPQLLQRLHELVLTGDYATDAWNPVAAARGGDYQCTSSTLLFVTACREQGVPVQAAAIEGHLAAVCVAGGATYWIETTEADGVQRLAADQARQLADRVRLLSDVQLVAAVAFSRGAELLAAGRAAEAIDPCLLAARLDPSSAAAANNAVVAYNRAAVARAFQDPAAAVSLLDAADAVSAGRPQTAANRTWLAALQ